MKSKMMASVSDAEKYLGKWVGELESWFELAWILQMKKLERKKKLLPVSPGGSSRRRLMDTRPGR
jgi:hypothetical protein